MLLFFTALPIILLLLTIVLKLTKKKKQLTSDTTVVITGGCMGIGKEIALFFALKHHCTIIIYDVRTDIAPQALKDIELAGGKGSFFECDVSNKQSVLKAFNDTMKKFPKIDILINNAGIVRSDKLENQTDDDLERVMRVNVWGPYYITKHFLPVMKAQGYGHIATMASITAHLYSPDMALYTASKAALFNLFSSFRLELKRENSPIKTTIVCPWAVDTGMFAGFKVDYDYLGVMGFLKPKDVAEKVYDGIITEKEEVYLPSWPQVALRVMYMLPANITDVLALKITKDSMKDFIARVKKSA